MVPFILFFIFITNVITDLPNCNNCKWFIPNKKIFDNGLCKMVQHKIVKNKKNIILYEYAQHCRDNEELCGKEGFLYEKNKYIFNINNIINEIEEIQNRCCGEVNEINEIEELEKDIYNLLTIIKKL